ncbi:hypothetical protein CWO84_04755 [Methylomonas sp. Kb3]|uniref:hypothetical protein n=1 Tax=Methylomonas sp. Kb3 TaxID=1611544 RepID=UPI000C34A79E|nr:hypothetical protein [Methylomonas sp. Kb3]PKD41446.1 hypothetical protein CWO84_04755 [Methylomonas sp. Kb3]
MKIDEIEQRLLELKTNYEKQGRSRLALREAFGLCTKHDIPLPDWVIYGLEHVLGCSDTDDKLAELENVYSSGHLGAIADAVSLCYHSRQPVPSWVHSGLMGVLYSLSTNRREFINNWLGWGKKYHKDMMKKQIYDLFLMFREEGLLTENDSYLLSGVEYYQEIPEGLDSRENRLLDSDKLIEHIENICNQVSRGIKINPYRWHMLTTLRVRKLSSHKNSTLAQYFNDTIAASKPKKRKPK